ncbi:preprotein translocase subunit TatB [Achromobacter denitrificans]|uniref:hypothetical protein n=1 Tax=Achromobacter ruhlandii TaxID=72557 RepID=UPI000742F3D9|nr:hypothetical protein [Achromobacter ruhlandii]ALX84854.1 preprotein translocase subunit TatB [Achromobacter denitrificans]MCZ8397071.1 preprotein translocase subunit TatB [Achromobacter ruhlandii]
MIVKILMLAAVVAALFFMVMQPRRGRGGHATGPAPARRTPLFIALCLATALALTGTLVTAVIWMGSVAGGVTGGGYHGEADFLLTIAGALLAIAVACGVGAFLKRKG